MLHRCISSLSHNEYIVNTATLATDVPAKRCLFEMVILLKVAVRNVLDSILLINFMVCRFHSLIVLSSDAASDDNDDDDDDNGDSDEYSDDDVNNNDDSDDVVMLIMTINMMMMTMSIAMMIEIRTSIECAYMILYAVHDTGTN